MKDIETEKQRKDEKPKYSYLYTSMMDEVVLVRAFGIKKYGSSENWRETTKSIDLLNATERHIRKIMDGDLIDLETGLLHAAHAICNLMFEIERYFTPPNKKIGGMGVLPIHHPNIIKGE